MDTPEIPEDTCFLTPSAEWPERPDFDYPNMPYLPREGFQSKGNNKYATRAMFLETAEEAMKPFAPWCLSEHEIFAYGRWYPSAWMVYIHATDEYDALRKICGNVRQWERIKAMKAPKDFSKVLADWHAEWAYLQKAGIRKTLLDNALAGAAGYTTAAKMLLAMIDGKNPVGRPKKEKVKVEDAGDVDADHERVVQLFGDKGSVQ
jgi:hypothetical protein